MGSGYGWKEERTDMEGYEAGEDHGDWHHAQRDSSQAPTEKGWWKEKKYLMVEDRTEHFTEDFALAMDEQNKHRMAELPPWVQKHVIYTYGPKNGKEIHCVDKYFGGVIGGVRKLAQSGMTEDESMRMITLSKNGMRLSYHACLRWGKYGVCKYGWQCKHPHVHNIWEERP